MSNTSNVVAGPRQSQPSSPSKVWLYVNITLAIILIFAGIVTLFWMGQQAPSNNNASAGVVTQAGQPAPDFSLVSLEGETVQLSDFSGQVVMVNLWATWCPPCKAEMPTINAYYQAHKNEGFVVLAVNNQENKSQVSKFIQTNGFSFPVLLDAHSRVITDYNVRGLPTSFIIDRDGQIQHTHTGQISREQLEEIVGPLL